MYRFTTLSLALTLCTGLPAMAQNTIRITSPQGSVMAELNDSPAAQALLAMLPLDLAMTDHLRQEKTGDLPQALPAGDRQRDFSTGTLGLWSSGAFCHLLPRRPGPLSRDRDPGAGAGRRGDL